MYKINLCKTVSVLCIFLGILHGSESLKCYVCNSAIHTKCESPPSKEHLVECTDATAQPSKSQMAQRSDLEPQPESRRNYTFCRKTVASIPRQENKETIRKGETRIVRACGWLEPDVKDNCKWGATDGVHRQMCTCKENECNSAPAFQFSIFSYASGFLIFLISRLLIQNI